MTWEIKNYPPLQFTLFRVIFGLYLIVHFGQFIFSRPNIPDTFDSFLQTILFFTFLTICSLCITIGFFRKTAALFLLFGLAYLFYQNNLPNTFGILMIGWLLLAMILIPEGEPLCLRAAVSKNTWRMSSICFWGGWVIVGLVYTINGFEKLTTSSWQNGTAIEHLLKSPLARDWLLPELFLKLPDLCLHIFTWAVPIIEITFGLSCLFKGARPIAWLSIMCMHLGILLVIDFPNLMLGFIMIHLFTFDPSWFKPNRNKETQNVVLFDGVCGLCNGWINFLLSIDLDGYLKYSTLQGSFAQTILSDAEIKNMKTIVYVRDHKTLTQSAAILAILRDLGGIWTIFSLLKVIPAFPRDFLYTLISENRYKIFGKHETCRLPTPEERAKFID